MWSTRRCKLPLKLMQSALNLLILSKILQLGGYHPVHGMIVASPFAQFDGNRFYDSEYVRAYRKKLLDYVRSGTQGFGLRFDGTVSNLNVGFVDNQWIKITYSIGAVRFSTKLWISKDGEVTQSTVLSSDSASVVDVCYKLSLELSVNRASYGQLTEGGPIPIPPSKNETMLFSSGYRWAIVNENLDAMIEGTLYENGQPVCVATEIGEDVVTGSPARGIYKGRIEISPARPAILTATFTLKPGIIPTSTVPQLSICSPSSKGDWKLEYNPSSIIIRRNLEYILSNCAIPVGNNATCFITDHVALPLGWNRDN